MITLEITEDPRRTRRKTLMLVTGMGLPQLDELFELGRGETMY